MFNLQQEALSLSTFDNYLARNKHEPYVPKISEAEYSKILELCCSGNYSSARHLAYKFGKYLDEGGDRASYLIFPEHYQRAIVLKIDMYTPVSSPEDNHEQNRHEVFVCKNLKHPYVPKIYDYDAENFTFLEMEYLTKASYIPSLEEIAKFAEAIEEVRRQKEEFKGHGNGFAVNTEEELSHPRHWGIDSSGNIKALDLGF